MKNRVMALAAAFFLLVGNNLFAGEKAPQKVVDLANSTLVNLGTDPVIVDAVKAENAKGKTLDEIKALNKDDILDMLGIELGPVRLKCALLSLKVIKAGVYGLGQASDDLVE